MKKFLALSMIGAAFTLSACSQGPATADYAYDSQAPYASERTVGTTEAPATKSAEPMFNKTQRK